MEQKVGCGFKSVPMLRCNRAEVRLPNPAESQRGRPGHHIANCAFLQFLLPRLKMPKLSTHCLVLILAGAATDSTRSCCCAVLVDQDQINMAAPMSVRPRPSFLSAVRAWTHAFRCCLGGGRMRTRTSLRAWMKRLKPRHSSSSRRTFKMWVTAGVDLALLGVPLQQTSLYLRSGAGRVVVVCRRRAGAVRACG